MTDNLSDNNADLFKYIEVKSYDSGEVVRRFDVSDKSNHLIEKAEMGINRQIDSQKYYTFTFESEKKLEEINTTKPSLYE